MTSPRNQVLASIQQARAELETALSNLELLPAVDSRTIVFIAHALNNFLTVNRATSELLLVSLKDYPDPQVRLRLEGMVHVNKLMTNIASRLMSNSGTGDAQLLLRKADLVALAQTACEFYQRLADRKQISILFSSGEDVPSAWTDLAAVAAVLDNLLSNAVKYSEPGKRVWVQIRGEGTSIVCSVHDEGPGLSEQDQAKLYQRGVRLTPVPTAGEPTMGYGLAVAKELVDRLGGELSCESQLGLGATFSFRLPIYEAEKHEAKTERATGTASSQ
jgi:signal transduction histidine kinase